MKRSNKSPKRPRTPPRAPTRKFSPPKPLSPHRRSKVEVRAPEVDEVEMEREKARKQLSVYNVIRSENPDVNIMRAMLAQMENIILPSQTDTSIRIDGIKARSALGCIAAYNTESSQCRSTCIEKNLERSVKRILSRPYLRDDKKTMNRCVEVLISMFANSDNKLSKVEKAQNIKLQKSMKSANLMLHLFRVLENNIEDQAIARSCTICIHLAGRKDAAIAKEMRKQGGLELVKRTIEIHAKNKLTGGLVLIPSKKALETIWFGAKGNTKTKKVAKASFNEMKAKVGRTT